MRAPCRLLDGGTSSLGLVSGDSCRVLYTVGHLQTGRAPVGWMLDYFCKSADAAGTSSEWSSDNCTVSTLAAAYMIHCIGDRRSGGSLFIRTKMTDMRVSN